MKKRKMLRRGISMLLAVFLCMSCLGGPVAFAAGSEPLAPVASSAPQEPAAAKTGEESPDEPKEADGDAETNGPNSTPEDGSGEMETPAKEEPDANVALSEAAQAFVAAVDALDREKILSAGNAWGLAHLAWLENQDDPDLQTALDNATAVSDEAAAQLYAAEDLFYEILEDEQTEDAVQTAYLALMSIVTAMHLVMDNPVAPTEPSEPDDLADPGTEGGDEPQVEPNGDEIARILYGDLPDKPTDYYMGRYGLPVAVGETKISIGEWSDDLLADGSGRMDADALNADGINITVPMQADKGYAVIPIMVQVEYPADGSSSRLILPDGAKVLCPGGSGKLASKDEAASILNSTYSESSAAVSGILVQASENFTAQFEYAAPDGTVLKKSLNVHLDSTAAAGSALYGAGSTTYAERPAPAVTSGKITQIQQVNGTWLVWFNGEPAYCCDHGLNGRPADCPTYSYSHTSIVEAAQYTPGDHYANQVNIWGGLGQLSLGLLHQDNAALLSAEDASACYDDVQKWVMEHYPNSLAARAYQDAVDLLTSGAVPFATDTDYYTYIYEPPIGGWQRVAVIGPATDGSELPDVTPQYYASWSASPQTVSGSRQRQEGCRGTAARRGSGDGGSGDRRGQKPVGEYFFPL